MLSSTLRSATAQLQELAERSPGLVSISVQLRGAINICVDDEAGVFQAVAHLVKRHGCRRIAFVTGPEDSVDGARRFASYRSALEHFGLRVDPALVVGNAPRAGRAHPVGSA